MDISFIDTAGIQRAQANGAQANSAVKAAINSRSAVEARKTAESFEAVFIAQMLAPMFESVPTDDMFGGGHAESIFRSMQVEEFGKDIAKRGGVGIADAVFREIMSAQEV